MKWVGHVTSMGKSAYMISVGKLEGDHLQYPGVDERKLLK